MLSKGFVPQELVTHEVSWFYSNLGIDDTYFASETIDVMYVLSEGLLLYFYRMVSDATF